MKDRKGQALIEFIIIIPILILIISCIIDFGNIIYEKHKLQNDLDTVAEMYQSKNNDDINNYLSNIQAEFNVEKKEKYTRLSLKKDININTIIINDIIGKKYNLLVSKTIIEGDNNG